MSTKSILSVIVILICLLLFSGCDDKSAEQLQSKLEQVQVTLDTTKAELAEAEKWKTEHDKLYVRNQNLEGLLESQKNQMQELADRITRDQEIIKELQQALNK